MPSELDDIVFLPQGPADKPQGLTFDDVPMILNRPSKIHDPTWRDDLAARVASDPRLSSTRVVPGSIPRSSALGPWNLFVGPESPDRPSYVMEPVLYEQLKGGIPREGLPKGTYGDESGVVRYKDTGQPMPIVARPGLLPLVATPEGVKVALPRLIDWILQGAGGGTASAPARVPRAVRATSAQAADARAAHLPADAVLDGAVAEAQVGADMQVARAMPPASNDNTAPARAFFRPPNVQRHFNADYPKAPVADWQGNLVEDMDRQLLNYRGAVVGRKRLGEASEPLREEDQAALARLLTFGRGGLKEVQPHEMKRRGSLAEAELDEHGLPMEIRVLRTLSPEDKATATARGLAEAIVAHARPWLDRYVGAIDRMEMRRVYNELGNPNRMKGGAGMDAKPFTPRDRGYPRDKMLHELLVEATRGYLTGPDWFKSIAPSTAQILRQVMREHPRIDYLAFNSLAPMMVGGAGAVAAGVGALGSLRGEEGESWTGG